MSAPSPPAQVVPAAYSYTSTASTPLSSPGLIEVPWFAKLGSSNNSNECYCEEEMYPQQQPLNLIIRKPRRKVSREPKLPSDPRQWSRADVCHWVEWTCASHNLPLLSVDRFLMNGKAVCLMSVQMFSSRVPLGGKLLYRDFQIRLAKAVNNVKNV